ncbi:hypothetical protein Thiowin_00438 [Thiorhodovibrio winogradskyi]|uniref:Phage protein n=1 Tax=Thiorhodovibrio winogradskyi TaxID=77007 RepID=A0ABZ0S5E1_9GAMM|nr:hypothetical protein [Thiorhodovibrio winogradskyi]
MKLRLDSKQFDELQRIFTAEIVERIKMKLQEAKLQETGFDQARIEDLTAEIALSITGIIDDLAGIEIEGLEVHPYLTFRASSATENDAEDDELIHCGENAYTYEQVYGAMRKLFHP